LTYSEVEGDQYYYLEEGSDVKNELSISSKPGETGTHYLFVDSNLSAALKQTLIEEQRGMIFCKR